MLNLKVIIFNVEHGFCAFVRSPIGYTLLIDCGKTSNFSPIKYVLDYELENSISCKGRKLTHFILSHPHGDHIEDIDRLVKDFTPAIITRNNNYDWDVVRDSNRESDQTNLEGYVEWQSIYTEPAPDLNWGMVLNSRLGLSPQAAFAINESRFVNNSSKLVMIEYPGSEFTQKFLFAGDVEREGWLRLLQDSNFQRAIKGTDFFITSHHGHSSGYCKEIFEVMGKPKLNIVSARSRDTSVESAYSKPEHAHGIDFKGEKRYMLSTRNDGSIFIDINAEGKYSLSTYNLGNNV